MSGRRFVDESKPQDPTSMKHNNRQLHEPLPDPGLLGVPEDRETEGIGCCALRCTLFTTSGRLGRENDNAPGNALFVCRRAARASAGSKSAQRDETSVATRREPVDSDAGRFFPSPHSAATQKMQQKWSHHIERFQHPYLNPEPQQLPTPQSPSPPLPLARKTRWGGRSLIRPEPRTLSTQPEPRTLNPNN